MPRQLTEEELAWLEYYPPARSHDVTANDALASCDDCDWVAQADTFDYLMEQATTHLKDTFAVLSPIEEMARRRSFSQEFKWDPWRAGVLLDGDDFAEDIHVFDEMTIVEIEDGESVGFIDYEKDRGHPDDYLGDDDG